MRLSHILHCLSLLILSFISFNTNAIDIVVQPIGLFHSSTPGQNWFPTVGNAIELFNQVEKQKYDDCVAGIGPGSGGFCAYNVVKQPEVRMSYPSQGPLIDGVFQFTYFRADRVYSSPGQRDNEETNINWTYVSFLHGWYCPDGFILDYKYRAPDYSVMTGAYCIKKNILQGPPSTSCDTKPIEFGNPIDAATSEKREHEIDYATADGVLKLERFYISQFQGWQFAIPSQLIDLSQLRPDSCYSATYRLNTESRTHCFEYMPNPVSSQQQVLIKTGKNNLYTFNKNANGSLTGANPYTGTLVKLTDNTWVHTQHDNSQDFYSTQGLLIKRKLVTGREIFYQYTGSRLTSMGDDFGRYISLHYDGAGRIDSASLPDGNTVEYEYDSYNNVTRVIFPDGTNKQYLYNESGLVSVDYGTTALYLTGKIDERGIRNGTYKYVDKFQNFSISTEQADGVNKYGRYVRPGISDGFITPLGSIVNANFTQLSDGTLLLRSISQPAGSGCNASSQYLSYNSSGLISQRKEFNGNVTQYGYNANKLENVRVEGLYTTATYLSDYDSLPYLAPGATLPDGRRKISTEWHPDFRVKTRIAEAKKITTNIYNNQPDPFNNNQILTCAPTNVTTPLLCKKIVQATTDGNGSSGFNAVLDLSLAAREWRYTYNEFGKILTVSTPKSLLNNNVETVYEYYDSTSTDWHKGDLKSVRNALGHTTQYTRYDPNGRLLEMIDVNGVVSQFTYDLRGRLKSVIQDNSTTAYDYDPVGNLIRVTQPDGVYLEYDYDNASRLFRIRDQLGNKIDYTLDKASNITAIKYSDNADTLRYQQTRVYDALSRVKNIIDASNNITTLKYDASGNLTSEIDAKNQTTSQSYDALDQFKQRTDALNGKINYSFDAQGNLTNVKDPRNNSTAYVYNAFGDLIEQVSPDTGKTIFTYNAAGQRISSTDARNITVNYSYDQLNRLTHIAYPDPAENVQYVYDNTNNNNKGIGRLTSIVKSDQQIDYVYDEKGLIEKKIVTLNSISRTIKYTHNNAGRLTTIIYPSGREVIYDYNLTGQITAIRTKTNSNSTEQMLIDNVQYLPFGPAQSYTYGNGLTHSQTYDQNYRLTAIQIGSIFDRSYAYDPVNNIESIVNNIQTAQSQAFNYDALNRLTAALGEYGDLIYTYDAVGNRLSETRNGSTDSYSYESNSNRLTNITRATGNRDFTYDNAGNPTQRTSDDNKTHSNTFNNANRLSSVDVDGALAATYTYNPLGQRTSKVLANGNKEIYFYDEAGQLIAVTDGAGAAQREYIYWGNQQVALIQNGNVYYVHHDHLNTPQVVTNQNQQVVWMGSYEPFGKLAENQSNSIEIFSRFPGQYFDQETNLYYNYFRDYDPSIGRYIESDPIGLAGGINTYGYALQNPILSIDPLGLDTYKVNRVLGGDSAKSRSNILTHTYVFTTNIVNKKVVVANTYSWGNSANINGWNKDQPEDIKAATEALEKQMVEWVGYESFDEHVEAAFHKLNKIDREHKNGVIDDNCKTESQILINTAKAIENGWVF